MPHRLSSLLLRRHLTKPLTTTTPPPPPLTVPLSYPIYLIWSSNTSLGKTLVSAGLAASSLRPPPPPLLPLHQARPNWLPVLSSTAAIFLLIPGVPKNYNNGMCDLDWSEETRLVGNSEEVSKLVCKTMYAWGDPVSPHLAAERENGAVEDSALLEMLQKCLETGLGKKEVMDHFCVVETAGGVASPGPSGSLQCDLYRAFRLPAILVGDGVLGGISGTISAYETLKLRGYDVVAIVLEDHGLVNEVPLTSYFRHSVPVLVLPPVPQDLSDDLMEWYDDAHSVFDSLMEIMLSAYSERIKRLHDMPKRAVDVFWWPFTQHTFVPEGDVMVIDSRCGENFAVFKVQNDDVITQQFDACASWWTQGPDATLQVVSD